MSTFLLQQKVFFWQQRDTPGRLVHDKSAGASVVAFCLFVSLVNREGAAMEDGCTVAALAFFVPGHVGKDLVGLEVDDLRNDDTFLLDPVDLIDVLADFGYFIFFVIRRSERGRSSASISARRLPDSRC